MIIKIFVERAEGPHHLCGKWEFTGPGCEEQANHKLREISRTAPATGGYDKTDVIITFDCGQTFQSRHDVQQHNIDGTVIEHAARCLLYWRHQTPKWLLQAHPNIKEDSLTILLKLRNGWSEADFIKEYKIPEVPKN